MIIFLLWTILDKVPSLTMRNGNEYCAEILDIFGESSQPNYEEWKQV